MADKRITELTNITGTDLVDADEFVVVDISADETKAITLGELKTAFDIGTGFVRITGDTMTGDLTVPNLISLGTVDGRDIATDGTKLDGIAAGATVDQTPAEIKVAYESNADTNEFSDAEQTKLAGIATGATAYSNADVDSHVNVSTATASQVLSWTGSDYDWITFIPLPPDPVYTGTPVEDIYTISGTSYALEPSNGSIQTHTLTGATTYTDAFSAGQAITLMIDDGSAATITWPTMTWVNNAGVAPTLATTGYTVITVWKVGSTLYGALVGDGS